MTVVFVANNKSVFSDNESFTSLMRLISGAEIVGIVLVETYDTNGNANHIPKALKYVALGNSASDRLNELGIQHLSLPQPSEISADIEAETIERLKDYVTKK